MSALYHNILQILQNARVQAARAVNFAMVEAYWEIGRTIIEEEQEGKYRAEYGKNLLQYLSQRLTSDFGKGFNETNLKYIRQFYSTFPNRHALRDQLSSTHYRALLRVENSNAREFYIAETIGNNWGAAKPQHSATRTSAKWTCTCACTKTNTKRQTTIRPSA